MFITSSGLAINVPEDYEYASAKGTFMAALDSDLLLFYKYQLSWLHCDHWFRLGPELGGSRFTGERANLTKAATLLAKLSGYERKQIDVRTNKKLPITEGMLRFQRLTYSFLPYGEPTLFQSRHHKLLLSQLIETHNTALAAVEYILNNVRAA